LDADGNEVEPHLADTSGLYCATRSGEKVKVVAPKHGCIFQLGEAAQLLSGGRLVAVPHMVQGSDLAVSREQFALFMEPSWDQVLGSPGCSREETLANCVVCDPVPPLAQRWDEGVTFGAFLAKSFAEYYKHDQDQAADGASTESGSASD
jgi:isopenicillin N synthase-like dioxygenase